MGSELSVGDIKSELKSAAESHSQRLLGLKREPRSPPLATSERADAQKGNGAASDSRSASRRPPLAQERFITLVIRWWNRIGWHRLRYWVPTRSRLNPRLARNDRRDGNVVGLGTEHAVEEVSNGEVPAVQRMVAAPTCPLTADAAQPVRSYGRRSQRPACRRC
jgi:hypothetical protein